MKVSSKHLSLVSPVFKAMFRRENAFKEGTDLQAGGVVKVPLPDDDAAAFRIILNIVHVRHRYVPKTVNLNSLLQIAILVDKYQMVQAVEGYTGVWIPQLQAEMPKSLTPEVYTWIEVAWVFTMSLVFESLTRLIIRESRIQLPTDQFRNVPIPEAIIGGLSNYADWKH